MSKALFSLSGPTRSLNISSWIYYCLEQETGIAQVIAIFHPPPEGDVTLYNLNVSTMSVLLKTQVILLRATCVVQLLLTRGCHLCKGCGSHPELQGTLGRKRWGGFYLGKLRGKTSNLNISPTNVLLKGWEAREFVSLETSCKWSCIINVIYPWIYNLYGADPPGLPVSLHRASMCIHTTVENAFRCQRVVVNQSLLWPPPLFPSPQGGNVLCFILSSHHLFLLKEQDSFVWGSYELHRTGGVGGFSHRVSEANSTADFWVHHVPWCHKDTTNREKSCSHVLWELGPYSCQDSGFPGSLKLFGPQRLYIAQGIRCQTLTFKKAHGKQIKMTS